MKIRWLLIIALTCAAILVAGYRLTQIEPEVVSAAAPAPVIDRAISQQATTVEEVQARVARPLTSQNATFSDELFGYRLSYPADWTKTELSSNVVVFQSANGATRVKVEVAGVLPSDGLSRFVERSLEQDILLTRQQLTIHGLPAERVQLYSNTVGGQVTNFYISAENMIYIISGSGEQKLVEAVARSFNAPQEIALR
jgi:hypothetical protein